MPLFEDDTLEGAIRKATAGLGRQRKSLIPEPEETFDNRPFGSRISGTGREGFASRDSAVQAAVAAMVQQAADVYPDRVNRMRNGERQRSVKIPELGTAVTFYLASPDSPDDIRWRFGDIRVGDLDDIEIGFRDEETYLSVTDLVHAHWKDNVASGNDRTAKSQYLGRSNRTYPNGERYQVRFYIYSFLGGLSTY